MFPLKLFVLLAECIQANLGVIFSLKTVATNPQKLLTSLKFSFTMS